MVKTLEWTDDGVRLIDQRKLPAEEVFVTCRTYQEVAEAIRNMTVRGAPAIGVAAAMGIALGVRASAAASVDVLRREFESVCEVIGATRPTAVNLFWAIRRMRETFARNSHLPVAQLQRALVAEAQQMYLEDIAANQAIGRHGATLLPANGGVLTHCMAGAMMRQGKIHAVVVGADRVAANGDVANKIGTYTLAVLAKEHGIPFYVAAPFSTVDLECPDGSAIPIEQRSAREVTHLGDRQIAPDGVEVENPAFDITPNQYVTAIISERGVARPPYERSLQELARPAAALADAHPWR